MPGRGAPHAHPFERPLRVRLPISRRISNRRHSGASRSVRGEWFLNHAIYVTEVHRAHVVLICLNRYHGLFIGI